jgi:5-carboxymethyl-2-hydroxymuconate isomerase
LRRGRTAEARKALGQALLAAADRRLTDVYPTHPIGLTVEVHEIDPDMTFRRNTLRERAQQVA